MRCIIKATRSLSYPQVLPNDISKTCPVTSYRGCLTHRARSSRLIQVHNSATGRTSPALALWMQKTSSTIGKSIGPLPQKPHGCKFSPPATESTQLKPQRWVLPSPYVIIVRLIHSHLMIEFSLRRSLGSLFQNKPRPGRHQGNGGRTVHVPQPPDSFPHSVPFTNPEVCFAKEPALRLAL